MDISFAFASRSKKRCSNYCFNVILISNNGNFQLYDLTIEYISHMSTVFSCNFRLNSLRSPRYLQQVLISTAIHCSITMVVYTFVVTFLSSKNLCKTFSLLSHRIALWQCKSGIRFRFLISKFTKLMKPKRANDVDHRDDYFSTYKKLMCIPCGKTFYLIF